MLSALPRLRDLRARTRAHRVTRKDGECGGSSVQPRKGSQVGDATMELPPTPSISRRFFGFTIPSDVIALRASELLALLPSCAP